MLLDRSLQGTRAELRRESLLDQKRVGGLVELDRPGPAAQPAALEHLAKLLVEKRTHLCALERPEDDNAVDAVQELGAERLLQLVQHLLGRNGSGSEVKPTPGRIEIDEPMFEVRTITHRRKSATRPC